MLSDVHPPPLHHTEKFHCLNTPLCAVQSLPPAPPFSPALPSSWPQIQVGQVLGSGQEAARQCLMTLPAPTAPVLREYRSCWGPDTGLTPLTSHGIWAKAGLHRELTEGLSAAALVQLEGIYSSELSPAVWDGPQGGGGRGTSYLPDSDLISLRLLCSVFSSSLRGLLLPSSCA